MQISKNSMYGNLKVRHFAATADLQTCTKKEAWIWVLYCPAQHRRKGYAKGLMTSIIEFAKKEGIKKLCLNAGGFRDHDMEHDKLVKFYRSFGFKTRWRYTGYGCRMDLNVQ